MYSKLAFFIVSAFTLGALAAPGGPAPAPAGGAPPPPPPPPPPPSNTNKCNGGKLNCCNSVQDAKSSTVQTLAGTLGIPLGQLTGQVGLSCTPITALGAGGNSCTTQSACCKGNNFSGLVTLGCSPVNVNL